MDNSNISCSSNSSLVQDLLKQVKNKKEELQRVKNERVQLELQNQRDHEELRCRRLLTLHMDEGVLDALVKLDAAIKERQKLENQLLELTTGNPQQQHAVSLSDLRRELSVLQQEESDLRSECEELRSALKDTRGSEPAKQDRTRTAQNQGSARPARKRVAKK